MAISKRLQILMAVMLFCVNQIVFAQTTINDYKNSNIKISLQSFSFNKLLNAKIKDEKMGISIDEFLAFSAKNKFDAVDILSYYFPGYPKAPEDSIVYRIKKKVFDLGLDISGTGVRSDFANINPTVREQSIEHVKDWIDVAIKLGAPVVRIFAGNMPIGYEDRWEDVASYLVPNIKECVEYAKSKGVLIAAQNHGGFLKTAEETIKLVKLIDSEYFGVIVDTGYFLTEDPYRDMEKVMPYAFNFLLKESTTPNDLSIRIDLKRVMKILKESDFKGYVQIETLSPKKSKAQSKIKNKYDPYLSVPEFLKDVKKASNEEFKF